MIGDLEKLREALALMLEQHADRLSNEAIEKCDEGKAYESDWTRSLVPKIRDFDLTPFALPTDNATPETDAKACYGVYVLKKYPMVTATFARDLERQRNALQKELTKWERPFALPAGSTKEETEQCVVCGDYYPYPVNLHHDEVECKAAVAVNQDKRMLAVLNRIIAYVHNLRGQRDALQARLAKATQIPGLKSGHQMITPECRNNRGVTPAFLEASERLQHVYDNYARAESNEQVTWHLVLVRQETPKEEG